MLQHLKHYRFIDLNSIDIIFAKSIYLRDCCFLLRRQFARAVTVVRFPFRQTSTKKLSRLPKWPMQLTLQMATMAIQSRPTLLRPAKWMNTRSEGHRSYSFPQPRFSGRLSIVSSELSLLSSSARLIENTPVLDPLSMCPFSSIDL